MGYFAEVTTGKIVNTIFTTSFSWFHISNCQLRVSHSTVWKNKMKEANIVIGINEQEATVEFN
jgi:hypothetical protein